MDTLLQNAILVDGSGRPPFNANLLISGARIQAILPAAPSDFAGRVIDCSGLLVTPGFIDGHSHNDWFALSDEQNRFFDPFILQGITTFVAGNCGFSVSGYAPSCGCTADIGAGLFHIDRESAGHHSHSTWFDSIDRKCHVNMASLAGHGTARIGVNGLKDTPLSAENRARMLTELDEALQRGACGVSLGLQYEPGIYAPYDELVEVAKLCVRHDKVLAVHARAYSAVSPTYRSITRSHMLLAMDEMDRLVRETGVRLQYSHLIFVGRRTWKDVDEALQIIDRLRQDGFDVSFDMFPLNYGASIITVVLPDWYQAMSREQRRKPWNYLRLAAMVKVATRLLGFHLSDITITYAGEGNDAYIGKNIPQIARETGLSELDAYLHVCEISDFKASVINSCYQNDEIIRQLMASEHAMFMTDAWVERSGKQNGAIYGAFPLFIEKALAMGWPIERCVQRMTGFAAERFRLEGRGLLQEGCFADLNVIDPQQIRSRIDSEQAPTGILYTFINGQLEAQDGRRVHNPQPAGMAVRA